MDIGYFLKLMTEKNASDMFLTTGAPVNIKVEGKLYPLGNNGLPTGMVKKIAYSLMDEGQVRRVRTRAGIEHGAFAVKDAGRFRVNVFKQRGEIGMVIRAIKSEIPSIEQLQAAADAEGHHQRTARPGADGRLHRLGQIDHAGVDDRPPQQTTAPATSSPSRIRSSSCTGTRNRSSTSAKSAWTRMPSTTR